MIPVALDILWFVFNCAVLAGLSKDRTCGPWYMAFWGGLTAISGLVAVNSILQS